MSERIAFDQSTLVSFYKNEGNFYIDVRNDGEHHSTIRSEAIALIKRYNEANGTAFVVNAYVGPVHYRNGMGYPVTDKRFTVIEM